VFVKICGITSEEDGLLATALGADALGFIFAPSTRQLTADAARDIVRRLPHEIETVGVFRNERPETVVETVARVGLGGAQLHGHEPLREVRWIRERIPFVIRGYAAGDPALAEATDPAIDVVMLDAPNPGSGKVFDWSLADGAPRGRRILLAGGLTPDNVGEAIARVRPWGVDVSTGVEREPGRKDPTRLRVFIEEARAAYDLLEEPVDLVDGADADDAPFDWELDL
jgi:phosphoribosylanthranilate isomerase